MIGAGSCCRMYGAWDVFGDGRDRDCAKRQIDRVIGVTGRPKGVCMCGLKSEYAKCPAATRNGLVKLRQEERRSSQERKRVTTEPTTRMGSISLKERTKQMEVAISGRVFFAQGKEVNPTR